MSLHDKYLPEFHFREVHRIAIKAHEKVIFDAITTLDVRRSPVVRLLLQVRGMNAGNISGFQGMNEMGFTVLEIDSHREAILGLVGQFWKPSGNILRLDRSQFCVFSETGFLKATWNFRITKNSDASKTLETETRIFCIGPSARKKFRLYWFLIKPFSGLIRREMLRMIRSQAEANKKSAKHSLS